jgi:hypothetical protein
MPITLSVDREKKVIYSSLHGVIQDAEFAGHAETIRAHPQFDAGFDEILDGRGVTDFRVSSATLAELAKKTIYSVTSIHVVIVPRGPLSALAKSFQTAAEQSRPKFFIVRTPEEAYECLRKHRSGN